MERSDEELMKAYVAGDRAAFQELFRRHGALIQRLMQRDLSAPEEARDLVQQTFLQVHRARLDFDPEQRFKPWLVTIALNLKREYFRRLRRRPETLTATPIDTDTATQGQDALLARDSLAWAMTQIPAEYRQVIELHWLDGLSFAEVADCVGISRASAKLRAHRGYVRLRELLGARDVEGTPTPAAGI